METLRRCLNKKDDGKKSIRDYLSKDSNDDVEFLLNASKKYVEAGDSQMVADSKAIIDFNELLHDEMSKLRTKLGLMSNGFKKAEVKIVEPPKATTVEGLREEEKAEFKRDVENGESFIVNGKIDSKKVKASNNAKAKEIYNKYDELITPLLEKEKEEAKKEEPKVEAKKPEPKKEVEPKKVDRYPHKDAKIVEISPKETKSEVKVEEKKVIDVGEEVEATPIEISDSDRGFLIDKGYDNVEINRAQKEANRIISLPILEMFKELQKKGIFNLGRGEKMEGRPDLGLDTNSYNNTLRQIEEGKTTVTVKKLIDFLNQIKKDGTVPMLFDTGGMSEHNNVPLVFQILGETSGQEVGMSEREEESKLAEDKARAEYEKNIKDGAQYQKTTDRKGNVQKVLDRIKKVMPKVNVVVDEKMEAAGKVQGNTLTINPYYAGLDTPIHEAGHILIDAIGFNNKVIQSAVKQLKDTKLWKETKERYEEFTDEYFDKLKVSKKDFYKKYKSQHIDLSSTDKVATKNSILNNGLRAGRNVNAMPIYEGSETSSFIGYAAKKGDVVYLLKKEGAKDGPNGLVTREGYKPSSQDVVEITKDGQSVYDAYIENLDKLKVKAEEMLAKEVLAEAIGIEGAGIFDIEVEKSKFKVFLDYIYTKLKQLLGIDKNVAKSLAKQIIGGIGTKELTGTTAEAQMAKRKPVSKEEQDIIDMIEVLNSETDLGKYTNEQLLGAYEDIMNLDASEKKKNKYLKEVMIRIAMNIYDRQVAKNLKENPEFNPEEAARRDIQLKDIKFKVLSHFTEGFPTMQYLSEMWDEHFFDKVTESREKRKTNEELALEVIKDRNKKLGISLQRGKELIQSMFTNINYKYFEYLDNGKGNLITVKEAEGKGYSKAQIDYLKFVRELLTERRKLMADENVYNMDMEVLRMDKGFSETYKSEGITKALSSLIGNPHNLEKVRIDFTNPMTGKSQVSDYSTIERVLTQYGKQGIKEKAHSLLLITKYNMKARRQLKKGFNVDQVDDVNVLKVVKGGEYTLDENGNLQSKFSRKRSDSRSYSKDFYRAVHEYIDDNAHIKHISPLMPIIDSIELLNKKGVVRNKKVLVGAKDNVGKWMDEWKDTHVFKKKKEGIPELDLALRSLRFMTSFTTMLFNTSANLMNVFIGNYNNFREEGGKTMMIGQARLFGGKDRKYGVLNKYAMDILKKYVASSADLDSNPVRTLGGKFFELGFLGQKWGEFQIQGSGLLGLMTDKEYNSFEYKKNKYGVEELVVKEGVDEKELKKSILAKINRVSDVQGKYSEKDRMNIANSELGAAAMQMKTWMPMYFRARFGEKGSVKIAWDNLIKDGFKELRTDMKEKGVVKAFGDNKAFMKNLRGMMVTAFLVSLVYMDDDDDEKSEASKFTQKALSDVLFIFDPNNLKFTLTRPVASIGIIEKLIDAADHLFAFESDDFYKSDGKYGSKGDPKILGDMIGLTPGRKVIDAVIEED